MSRNQEIRPDIDDGIDRKVLTQLRGRFLKVNSGRLARTVQALSTRQQLVRKLLSAQEDERKRISRAREAESAA